MANYYLHHGAYPAYADIPTWGVSQDGDGTATGLSTSAIGSLLINAVAVATNTVTIAGAVLTAVAAGAGANQFNVGATVDIQADNIATSINAATNTTNSGTNNTSTQLRNWAYARGPSLGAPAGTVEIMTRVGSDKFNYATNSNVLMTSSGWGVAPTVTNFTGGAGGVYGYFISTGVMFPSSVAAGNYGFLTYAMGSSSIVPGAGDTVYVRTKSGGSDISCTNSTFNNTSINVRIFSTVPTNPTKVIFDNGTIWPGDNGVFKLSKTYASGSMGITFNSQSYISFIGKDRSDLGTGKKNFKIVDESSIAAGYHISWRLCNSTYHEHVEFSDEHTGAYVASSSCYIAGNNVNAPLNIPSLFNKCTFRVNNSSAAGYSFIRHSYSFPTNLYFKECNIYFTNQSIANGGLISDNTCSSATATSFVFDRCTFSGLFNGANRLLSTSGAGQAGKLPSTYLIKNCEGINNISGTFGYFAHGSTQSGTATGIDTWLKFISVSNKGLTYFESGLGYYILENTSGGYPTLYAQNIEGTNFSCLISPSSRATECVSTYNPFYTTEVYKFNTLTDGSRTINVEFLLDQNYSGINTENVAFELSYTNTSGVVKFYNTRADFGSGASFTVSTAPWSSTSYVVNYITHNYDKKRLEFTLPEDVKQNTLIGLKVAIYTPSPSGNDFIFLDPDFEVT